MIRLIVLLLALTSSGLQAQEVNYISDTLFVPVRSGPGSQYRIVHKGIPSGTRLTVQQQSEDGVFSEIVTDGGTSGWVRSQYLMSELPASRQVQSAQNRAASAEEKASKLAAELADLRGQAGELEGALATTGSEFETVKAELEKLRAISGNAVQLDIDNRRLVETSEMMKAETDTLEAENRRLQDKLDSDSFMNGALAVLLGVLITLAVPRLWPKRRNRSNWA